MDEADDLPMLLGDAGFAIVRSVFTRQEINDLRRQSNEILDDRGLPLAGGTVLPNAAVEAPELAWLFGHEKLLELAHRALAADPIMFTYEADLHRNYLAGAWHKDTGEQMMDGGYFGIDCFGRDDCRLIKFGIYLQEHVDGRGFHVRPGSQKSFEIDQGTSVAVDLHPGDVVVFDLRISHRGVRPPPVDQALRGVAQAVRKTGRGPDADAYRRRWNAFRRRPDRMALYVAFGLCNQNTSQFASRNMGRQWQHLGREAAELPEALRRAFDSSGVVVAEI